MCCGSVKAFFSVIFVAENYKIGNKITNVISLVLELNSPNATEKFQQ